MTREVGAPESHDSIHRALHSGHGESHRAMHGEAVTALSSPGESSKSGDGNSTPESSSALHPLVLTNRRRNPADLTASGAHGGGAGADSGFQAFDSRFSLPDLKIAGLVPDRDSTSSVSSLISRGVFHDARPSDPYQRTAAPERFATDTTRVTEASGGDKPPEQPEIVVQYGDKKGQPAPGQPQPDFVIRKDGSIEVHHDFEANPHGKVVVQMERSEGQLDPRQNPDYARQMQAQADLLKYLQGRLQNTHPEARANGVGLNDAQNLVPDAVQKSIGAHKTNSIGKDFSPETQHAVENLGRFKGAGHGSISRQAADGYFPKREVPYQQGETNSAAAFKDTVAALFQADKDHPYETVRRTRDGGHAVGRYGLTKHHISNWLAGLDLGDPPDPAKIAELIKQGKLPQGFNADSVKQLQNLANRLGDGNSNITGDEINRTLPKELQERIATDLSKQYTEDSHGDPSTAALAWLKGKRVNELTPQDQSDAAGMQIKDAAQKAYSLATGRQMSQAGDRIEFKDGGDGSPLGIQIAHRAQNVAESMGSVGYCKKGVRQALEPFGIHLQGSYAKDSAQQLASNPRVKEVSTSDLRPGDVLVHQPAGYGRTIGQRYAGHIAVYLGHGQEASDHVQHLIKGEGYGGTRAFRIVA
ncbi:MAG TPA: hypothetical protein V6C89_01650 [Drouetiella sp.]